MKNLLKTLIFIFFLLFSLNSKAANIQNIIIDGNERISDQTILMFADIGIDTKINNKIINKIIKDLYDSNFFENVSVKLDNYTLIINVKEFPLIESVSINGIKAQKIRKPILQNLKLKSRSSYNEFTVLEDTNSISNTLRKLGYYFSKVEVYVENIDDNKVKINYDITLGKKAKIKKISFIGDKIFKDRKLRSLIISEEYKFWKFVSGKKFLNEDFITMDQRLLRNFYLNKGYYNVEINSSFAKLINEDEFELVFNINSNKKFFFNELNISYPKDFESNNFSELKNLLSNLKGQPYSINTIENILDEIDQITVNEEYKSIKATAEENIISDKININFLIQETKKIVIEKINIFGNNITRESVIRNQLEVDEGDPFNEILSKKSVNNLKNLNFFKNVETQFLDGKNKDSKIINITVEEKATGEISAGAGFGTGGGTIAFGVKENNYLGKGIGLSSNIVITEEAIKGQFSVTNPNFQNSDKTVFAKIQALENDQLKDFGYKTNKTGFEVGTSFEYLDDLNLGLSTRSFYERIETNSSASTKQKKQEGDYWDTFINAQFDYDKRNQRYRTTDGFRSFYSLDMPLISETNTLTNTYSYRYFDELYENNISTFSLLLKSANSITGEDIKLSERLFIPSNKLRGFVKGKVGPKDGDDYIGGNFVTALNFVSTLPQVVPNMQNIDISVFFDAANVWGVDYDSSIDDDGDIRSSIGIGIDWFTMIGPLNFTFSQPITKETSDKTETFRFNIGTSF